MKATLCEQTFALGKSRFKVDTKGNWQCLMWGWYPFGHSPRYQWSLIPKEKVPNEILKEAGLL